MQGIVVQSRKITPVGYDTPAPVTIKPGYMYRIDNGAYTSAAGTIAPGQTLQLRATSPNTAATKFECDVFVGNTHVRWIGKTAP